MRVVPHAGSAWPFTRSLPRLPFPLLHSLRSTRSSGCALLTRFARSYFHNIKSSLIVPPAKLQPAARGHVDATLYANDTFGVHLRAKKGYNVGMFGKANFNTYEGFDRWYQGAYCGYGGSYEDNESPSFHSKSKNTDYATDVIADKAIEWMKRDDVSGASAGGRPFFVYFAPHCPHTPAQPAHKYEEECKGVISPRLPNYNWTHPGFHELVKNQPPLTQDDAVLIDDLARRRCQTLMSVDDAHARLVETVKELGQWNNTYARREEGESLRESMVHIQSFQMQYARREEGESLWSIFNHSR